MASSGVKQAQILELTPSNELRFDGPFNNVVTSYLKLYNPSQKRVCFKVKTTAPRRYCVRPNSGIVEPMTKVSIAIMLQPFEIDSQNDRNKHKFMVQSVMLNDDEGDINQETLWKSISNESIMDSKLRCVFQMPNNTTTSNSPPPPIQSTVAVTPSATTITTTVLGAGGYTTTTSSASQPSTQTVSSSATNSQQQQQQTGATTNKEETARTTPSSASSVSTTTGQRQPTAATWASNDNPSSATSKAVSSQANLSSGSLNSSLHQSLEEQKSTILIAAFIILIVGIILGKYII